MTTSDDPAAPRPEPKPVETGTQGEAVANALEGDRSIDIDRWAGFSEADAAKLAKRPPADTPEERLPGPVADE